VICVAQDVVSVVHGTVKKVDSATKTVVVKTADGTEHTIKVTGDTAYKGTKEGLDGLKEGTEVVARTTGTISLHWRIWEQVWAQNRSEHRDKP
jgi:hypothetical protein